MSGVSAFDGRPYVVDTSAWARATRRAAAETWSQAMLDAMREAPLDRPVAQAAAAALRELTATGPLHHRVPITDALIAAAAAERGVGVSHYDEHFDRLAAVLGFESRWIVARGSA